jgi:hypothetical protein
VGTNSTEGFVDLKTRGRNLGSMAEIRLQPSQSRPRGPELMDGVKADPRPVVMHNKMFHIEVE